MGLNKYNKNDNAPHEQQKITNLEPKKLKSSPDQAQRILSLQKKYSEDKLN